MPGAETIQFVGSDAGSDGRVFAGEQTEVPGADAGEVFAGPGLPVDPGAAALIVTIQGLVALISADG